MYVFASAEVGIGLAAASQEILGGQCSGGCGIVQKARMFLRRPLGILVEVYGRDSPEDVVGRTRRAHCAIHKTADGSPCFQCSADIRGGRESLHDLHEPVALLCKAVDARELLQPALTCCGLEEKYCFHCEYSIS